MNAMIKKAVLSFGKEPLHFALMTQGKEIYMFNFEEELKKLPKEPGVYIMRDDKDVILYVGKAVNLHNRVRS